MPMQVATKNLIQDDKKRVWLDMLSGILNVSLGHGSNVVRAALNEVAETGLVNTYDRASENSERLRRMLWEYAPRYQWKLLNTGAEAVERAVQLAATHFGRPVRVAVLGNSFHGKSISMSAARYSVPWGNPLGLVCLDLSMEPEDMPDFDVLLFEPVRGWDGVAANEDHLRWLCNAKGALMVADEMVTGFLRCGQRFLSTQADMIVSGKGLAQGVPLAVLGVCNALASHSLPIGWNTTCGGNNLSATVGVHVLSELVREEESILLAVANIQAQLKGLRFDRVYGALAFKDLRNDPAAVRNTFESAQLIASWHERHLRVGPSFITSDNELEELGTVLERAKE
jgi:acetylornithine/succinyldiaminopimelate/putrescine aminotransferase